MHARRIFTLFALAGCLFIAAAAAHAGKQVVENARERVSKWTKGKFTYVHRTQKVGKGGGSQMRFWTPIKRGGPIRYSGRQSDGNRIEGVVTPLRGGGSVASQTITGPGGALVEQADTTTDADGRRDRLTVKGDGSSTRFKTWDTGTGTTFGIITRTSSTGEVTKQRVGFKTTPGATFPSFLRK